MLTPDELAVKQESLLETAKNLLTNLKPEHEELILDFFDVLLNALAVFKYKQYDYGPGNIAGFGEVGVLVRLNDKIERLKNLMLNNKEINNESVYDTWLDIANYGLIGLMCKENLWPNVNQFTISKKECVEKNDT
jgi:hypothetical protein